MRRRSDDQAGLIGTTMHSDDFEKAYQEAFVRLKLHVETACAAEQDWPEQAAAGIRAALAFAAGRPEEASRLTTEVLLRDADGHPLYEGLISYLAELFEAGRVLRPENAWLPEITERAVAGGLVMLVVRRVDEGREAELPSLSPEAIRFGLTPYIGVEGAREIAGFDR
jgi:beta-phosphoglucomutase-like phosphatase (HAD superfamily)